EQYLRTFAGAIFSPQYVSEDNLIWSMPPHGILFYIGWLVFLGLIVLVLIGIRKRQLWAVGGIWFGLMLFPAYAFGQAYAPLTDTYTYAALPGIGLFVIDGLRILRERFMSGGAVPQIVQILIAGIFVMYGLQTFLRVPIVKTDETLWTHMAKVRPN